MLIIIVLLLRQVNNSDAVHAGGRNKKEDETLDLELRAVGKPDKYK